MLLSVWCAVIGSRRGYKRFPNLLTMPALALAQSLICFGGKISGTQNSFYLNHGQSSFTRSIGNACAVWRYGNLRDKRSLKTQNKPWQLRRFPHSNRGNEQMSLHAGSTLVTWSESPRCSTRSFQHVGYVFVVSSMVTGSHMRLFAWL
jgi:hypothetical protein